MALKTLQWEKGGRGSRLSEGTQEGFRGEVSQEPGLEVACAVTGSGGGKAGQAWLGTTVHSVVL